MEIHTKEFGSVEIQSDEVVVFATGIRDYPAVRHWVLLADATEISLYWLQAVTNHQLAIPVVEVRGFPSEPIPSPLLNHIRAGHDTPLLVLAEVCANSDGPAIDSNVFIINAWSRRGCELETRVEYPAQFAMPKQSDSLRKSA